MKIKIISIIVFILLIGVGISPITGNIEKDKNQLLFSKDSNIFYVGGTGGGNYSKIQYAIDNASDGDTVFVFNDSSPYYENIIIDKSINLIGEDKDTTVIDANNTFMSGDCIYISANWVNITGFTIRNAGEWFVDYGIEIDSNHCTIMGNNIVSNYNYGIRLSFSNNNNILGNYFSHNYYSVLLWGSSHNNISGNTIAYEHSGIGVISPGSDTSTFNIVSGNIIKNIEENSIYFSSSSNNNIIINNSITNSTYGISAYPSSYNDYSNNIINNCDFGLFLTGSNRCIVYGNRITFCDSYGLHSRQSDYDMISSNSISNSGHGIYLSLNSNNYTIIDNIITWNIGHGIYLEDSCGYTLFDTISNNTINYNNGHGIYFKNSYGYDISDNTINYNNGHGIFLNDSCNNNSIIYNIINSNNGYGIRLENGSTPCSNNIIYHNNFINNGFGGYDDCDNNTWDNGYPSGGNYWSGFNGTDDYRGINQTIPGSDSIGDIPNYLDGGNNKDGYPLMYLWGEQRPVANFTYSTEYGGYIFNGLSSYDCDGIVLFYDWDFGDGSTGQEEIATHGYNESGTYNVILTVTDDDGYKGSYTRSIDAEKNYPPSAPSIDGPTKGKAGKSHLYTFTSEDQELSDVSYYVEWGDGLVTLWSDFLPSGEAYHTNHGWPKGTYTIRAKAKDIHGAESDWATLDVTMPKNKIFIFNFPLLNWLFIQFPNAFPVLRYLLGIST